MCRGPARIPGKEVGEDRLEEGGEEGCDRISALVAQHGVGAGCLVM